MLITILATILTPPRNKTNAHLNLHNFLPSIKWGYPQCYIHLRLRFQTFHQLLSFSVHSLDKFLLDIFKYLQDMYIKFWFQRSSSERLHQSSLSLISQYKAKKAKCNKIHPTPSPSGSSCHLHLPFVLPPMTRVVPALQNRKKASIGTKCKICFINLSSHFRNNNWRKDNRIVVAERQRQMCL